MEIDKIASAAVTTKTAETQATAQARLLRASADQEANTAKLLENAQRSTQARANVPSGVGQVVDFKV